MHQISTPTLEFVDPRRLKANNATDANQTNVGPVRFTANGAGTTATIVGANATPATGVNVIRTGEKFKVFNSDGTLQEEKVVTVTDVTVAGSTTVTFTPALTAATASGDTLREVGSQSYESDADMDTRLAAIDSTKFSVYRLKNMTRNDKIYALRINDDPKSIQ